MRLYIHGISCVSPQTTTGREQLDSWVYDNVESLEAQRPDYLKYIDPQLVRRLGKSIRMALYSARLCIDDANLGKPDAVITATGLGAMAATEKFLEQVITNQEENLVPYAFVQTTFNVAGAQIALDQGIKGYNMTWVNKGISFDLALTDAALYLEEHPEETVLVGGFDELTKKHASVLRRAGKLSAEPRYTETILDGEDVRTIPGEGAAFFIASSHQQGSRVSWLGSEVLTGKISRSLMLDSISRFLEERGISKVDMILSSESGHPELDKNLSEVIESGYRGIPLLRYKNLCGEYETSSAFAMWLAYRILDDRSLPENSQIIHRTTGSVKDFLEKIDNVLILNLEGRASFGMHLFERVRV